MSHPRPSIVCIGGATVDRTYQAPAELVAGTPNPVASARQTFGGVARNVAENLARLGMGVALVSMVGDDENGRALASDLNALGIEHRLALSAVHRTAEYVAVLQPSGHLAFGLADMAVFGALTEDQIDAAWPLIAAADWVFADCNLPTGTIRHLVGRRRQGASFKLAIDAVSTPKALRLPDDLSGIDCLFTNRDEARALLGITGRADHELAGALLERGAAACVLTLGADGALAAERGSMTHVPSERAEVIDVTGAGDALIAGTLFRLAHGSALIEAPRTGVLATTLTIESQGSVRRDLSPGLLHTARRRHIGAEDPEEA